MIPWYANTNETALHYSPVHVLFDTRHLRRGTLRLMAANSRRNKIANLFSR
jgi:hypothetical protein